MFRNYDLKGVFVGFCSIDTFQVFALFVGNIFKHEFEVINSNL
jgi:hypothetical protein